MLHCHITVNIFFYFLTITINIYHITIKFHFKAFDQTHSSELQQDHQRDFHVYIQHNSFVEPLYCYLSNRVDVFKMIYLRHTCKTGKLRHILLASYFNLFNTVKLYEFTGRSNSIGMPKQHLYPIFLYLFHIYE